MNSVLKKISKVGFLTLALTSLTFVQAAWAQTPTPSPSPSPDPVAAATAAAAAAQTSGDTAFMLICSALVLLMTPGLAFFYGGFVKERNVLNTLMMSFILMALVGVSWVLWGYSLSFAPGTPFIGSLQWAFLNGVGLEKIGRAHV